MSTETDERRPLPSSKHPLHPEDRPLDEVAMVNLFPGSERAWECSRCHLCYASAAKHADFYPRCRA